MSATQPDAADFRAGLIAGLQSAIAHEQLSIGRHRTLLHKIIDEGATHELVHEAQAMRGRLAALEGLQNDLAFMLATDGAALLARMREAWTEDQQAMCWSEPEAQGEEARP